MSETTSGGAGGQVRWGILGAASIARSQFLPGLRETGDGRAVIVASRNRERGEAFAVAEGVDRVTDNIRLSAALGGGALADVGCYPVRLAHELFGPADGRTAATGVVEGEVEVEAAGFVEHGPRRLLLGCGFRRPPDTFTRVLGDGGELRLSNPFHPGPGDALELHRPGEEVLVERPTTDARSFTAALRHIHAVVREEEPPRHLASESAPATARTLASLQAQVAR
jgi:predicted dehydrogenase